MKHACSLLTVLLLADTLPAQSGGTDASSRGGGACLELFFSEYVEGSANNKAIEVYNPTGADVDLTTYTLELYANGSATPTSTYAFTGILPSYQVVVLANSQADPAILALAVATPAVCTFNGDDALVLKNSGTIIDVIGEVGVDPGTSWPVDVGSTQNHTLVRGQSIDQGDTDWSTAAMGWTSLPQDSFAGLGAHSSICDATTGTPPQVEAPALSAFPLPADRQVVLEWTGPLAASTMMWVVDTQGRTVHSERFAGPRQVLSVEGFPEGAYFIRLMVDDHLVSVVRILVAR